jgi:hypothetical protein
MFRARPIFRPSFTLVHGVTDVIHGFLQVVVDGQAACAAACHSDGPGLIRAGPTISVEKVALFYNPVSGTCSQALQYIL